MIKWTGLAPWEFEFPFPGSLTSTFLDPRKMYIYTMPGPPPHPLCKSDWWLERERERGERERERERGERERCKSDWGLGCANPSGLLKSKFDKSLSLSLSLSLSPLSSLTLSLSHTQTLDAGDVLRDPRGAD